MLRVPVKKHERALAAWEKLCGFVEAANEAQRAQWEKTCAALGAAHDAVISTAHEIEQIEPLILPPAPEPKPLPEKPVARPPVFLLVEPPADMSTLPPAARQAVLGAALSLGGVKGRPATTADMVDAAYQAAAEICCACIVGVARVQPDGSEKIEHVQVRPVPAPGVLPLAAIDLEERLAVQREVQAHLATFRDLL